MLLKNATVYDDRFVPVKATVAVEGERIAALDDSPGGEVLDLTGLTVLPGFIDIHVHGYAGFDTSDASPGALAGMSAALVKKGVTSFCPTSMTLPYDRLDAVFRLVQAGMGSEPGAYMHGVHMEGPYISAAKKGAQNGAFVRPPDAEEFRRLYDGCGGCIRLVDVAPECEGAQAFIRAVAPLCPVSVAHTAADYDTAAQAFGWGARHVTHLYNAMTGLTHREPGVVGAALDLARSEGVMAELICDGFHIHPAALRVAFRLLGEDNSIIVSDAMRAAGNGDGEYELGGVAVHVRGGKATLDDGTIAASTTDLYEEFKLALRVGVPFRQAVKSVSVNPARAIRADGHTGTVTPGKFADLLVLDDALNIRLVTVKGRIMVNNL